MIQCIFAENEKQNSHCGHSWALHGKLCHLVTIFQTMILYNFDDKTVNYEKLGELIYFKLSKSLIEICDRPFAHLKTEEIVNFLQISFFELCRFHEV